VTSGLLPGRRSGKMTRGIVKHAGFRDVGTVSVRTHIHRDDVIAHRG
jgi:hypothetical protein